MAEASDAAIGRRLGIREGSRVLLLDPPTGFARRLEPLPTGAGVGTRPFGQSDLVVLFASSRAALGELFAKASHVLAPRGSIWAAWPRKSSGFFTDLTEELVRSVGLAHNMTDNKIMTLDEIWAALRFVVRERDRLVLPRQAEISVPDA
jgi:hypothetical protein